MPRSLATLKKSEPIAPTSSSSASGARSASTGAPHAQRPSIASRRHGRASCSAPTPLATVKDRESPSASKPSASRATAQILLVDDDYDARTLYGRYFQYMGMSVTP